MKDAQTANTADWASSWADRGYESKEEFELYLAFEQLCRAYGVLSK